MIDCVLDILCTVYFIEVVAYLVEYEYGIER